MKSKINCTSVGGRRRLAAATLVASVSCAAAVAGGVSPFAPPSQDTAVLYRHATLIDGVLSKAQRDMDVLVVGDRIRQVFRDVASLPSAAAGATVIELAGAYLAPGLVDAHVHLATPPNRRQAEAEQRRNLFGGVTAVRDMADDLRAVGELARESRVGEIPGPDIYYAALMAGPDFFSDPRTTETSVGGVAGQVPWMQAVDDTTDVPLAVALSRGTYATAIKLYADMAPDLARRITAEAHRQKMLVWAHATLYPAKPSDVVAAGVDAISHACLLVRETDTRVPRWIEPRSNVDLEQFRFGRSSTLERLFAVMASRGTILDATVWAYRPTPQGAAAGLTPPLLLGGCDDVVGGAITGQAYRAGVQIAAGTDSAAPASEQWPELFHELSALVDHAGMTPAAAFHSATSINARAAGQERDMGSIEPGKLANMLVLSENPLVSVETSRACG